MAGSSRAERDRGGTGDIPMNILPKTEGAEKCIRCGYFDRRINYESGVGERESSQQLGLARSVNPILVGLTADP